MLSLGGNTAWIFFLFLISMGALGTFEFQSTSLSQCTDPSATPQAATPGAGGGNKPISISTSLPVSPWRHLLPSLAPRDDNCCKKWKQHSSGQMDKKPVL